jgi:cell division protein FtsL
MKQKNNAVKTKEAVFERPIKIIIIVISIAALLLTIEAFYNHSNAVEQRKSLHEMNK